MNFTVNVFTCTHVVHTCSCTSEQYDRKLCLQGLLDSRGRKIGLHMRNDQPTLEPCYGMH